MPVAYTAALQHGEVCMPAAYRRKKPGAWLFHCSRRSASSRPNLDTQRFTIHCRTGTWGQRTVQFAKSCSAL